VNVIGLPTRFLGLLLAILVTMGPLGLVLEHRGWFAHRPLITNYWSGLVGSCVAIPVLGYLLDGSRTRRALREWKVVHLNAGRRAQSADLPIGAACPQAPHAQHSVALCTTTLRWMQMWQRDSGR
jgi:hypothetical protein